MLEEIEIKQISPSKAILILSIDNGLITDYLMRLVDNCTIDNGVIYYNLICSLGPTRGIFLNRSTFESRSVITYEIDLPNPDRINNIKYLEQCLSL